MRRARRTPPVGHVRIRGSGLKRIWPHGTRHSWREPTALRAIKRPMPPRPTGLGKRARPECLPRCRRLMALWRNFGRRAAGRNSRFSIDYNKDNPWAIPLPHLSAFGRVNGVLQIPGLGGIGLGAHRGGLRGRPIDAQDSTPAERSRSWSLNGYGRNSYRRSSKWFQRGWANGRNRNCRSFRNDWENSIFARTPVELLRRITSFLA